MAAAAVVFIVGTEVSNPADEAAFNEWYNKTHLPEVTAIPGVKSATRYEVIDPEPGYPRYLAIYEMEDEAAFRNFMEHRRRQQAGEIPDFTPGPAFRIVWRKAYRRIGP